MASALDLVRPEEITHIGDMQLWKDRYLVCTGESCISIWDIHSGNEDSALQANGRYQLAAKRMYYKDFSNVNTFAGNIALRHLRRRHRHTTRTSSLLPP